MFTEQIVKIILLILIIMFITKHSSNATGMRDIDANNDKMMRKVLVIIRQSMS